MEENKITCQEARIPMRMLGDGACVQSPVGEHPEIVIYSGMEGGLTVRKDKKYWGVEGDVPVYVGLALNDRANSVKLQEEFMDMGCDVQDVHRHVFHAGKTADVKNEDHIHLWCEYTTKREAIVNAVKMLAKAEKTYERAFK